MKSTLKLLLIPLLLCASTVTAIDWEITKIVEVGPASWGQLKFSPNGSRLAYYDRWTLMVADSLGNSRIVREFELRPHKYEWLNDDEIIVMTAQFKERSQYSTISRTDVNTGAITLLENYVRRPFGQPQIERYSVGPFRTIEGGLYYVGIWGKENQTVIKIDNPKEAEKKALSEEHFVRYGEDGVYLVNGTFTDSTRLGPKPAKYTPMPPIVSPDLAYVIRRGILLRFADSLRININLMLTLIPEGTEYCAVSSPKFNPTQTEVLFMQDCWKEDHESGDIEKEMVAIFDYSTRELTVIDTLIELENCAVPTYDPTGQRIALRSGGKAYILHREWK